MFNPVALYRQWKYGRYVDARLKAHKALTERIQWYMADWVNATCPTLIPQARGVCWPNNPRLSARYVANQYIQRHCPRAAMCLAHAPHQQLKAIIMAHIADICVGESEALYVE